MQLLDKIHTVFTAALNTQKHMLMRVLYYLVRSIESYLCLLWEDMYQISGVITPCGFHKVNDVVLNVPSR